MPLERNFQFGARARWVGFKKLLRIPRESDKDYFCELIIRGMMSQQFHPDTEFTGILRPDEGFGSQALSRLTVAATSHALGYPYRHTPLFCVGHVEGDAEQWTKSLEEIFALGNGELAASDSRLPPIDYREYAEKPHLWREPHLVSVRDFAAYTKAHPSSYHAYITSRREPLLANRPSKDDDQTLRVAVHVRRGDVNRKATAHRFLSNDDIMTTLAIVVRELRKRGTPFVIEIFTNGTADDFSDFSILNVSLALGMGAIETLGRLASADILITGNSSFSFLAALLSDGIVLYEDQAHRPLAHWIPIKTDRTFSRADLRSELRDAA